MAASKDPAVTDQAVTALNGVKVKQSSSAEASSSANGHSNGYRNHHEQQQQQQGSSPKTLVVAAAEVESTLDTKHKYAENLKQPGRTMADRNKTPMSFYITTVSIVGLYICSGMLFSLPGTMESIRTSLQVATDYMEALARHMHYLTSSALTSLAGQQHHHQQQQQQQPSLQDYAVAIVATTSIAWIVYVLFVAPLLGGFWTGRKASKHVFHRYMGLLYLIQYPLAWLEFAQGQPNNSFLPHLVALNGIIQAWSAFFTFKVLPELNDAGYYGDKSVLSRSFVHENAFFQMMCVFGSIYYHDECRAALRSSWPGRILEYIYIFWSYILVRPFFPTTRFKDAGQTHKGRSSMYESFYQVATFAVKIFFLYAKYFLGFYFNFLIFLDLPTPADWKLLRGCLLLNIGTVSIAIFLHTLRFKKIFPGVFTFSVYLAQIYATILGIPFCYHIFSSHPKLMLVCLAGLLCNMTRNRNMHAAWCFVTMCLLSYKGIEW